MWSRRRQVGRTRSSEMEMIQSKRRGYSVRATRKGKKNHMESCTAFNLSTHRLLSCPGNAETRKTDRCTHRRPLHMGRDISSSQYYGCMLANGTRPKRPQRSWGGSDRP